MNNLDVHPRIITAIKKARLTGYDSILSLSAPDLVRFTKLSASDIQVLRTAVAEEISKLPMVTALELHHGGGPGELQIRKLSTGCSTLDQHLRGGIINRGITEIAGESSSGKTQLCLQLCLTAQLPIESGGLKGGAAYICTEDVFPNKRLHQMIECLKTRMKHQQQKPIEFGDHIYVEHVPDYDGLMQCISKKLPTLLARDAIQLIIVDSVAALFRSDYDSDELIKRAKHMSNVAAQLRRLGRQYRIPIVCVNQVSASFKDTGRKMIPSLGLAWSNLVTTRFMLSRTTQTVSLQPQQVDGVKTGGIETIIRTLEVMFAPHLPSISIPFIIDQQGVKGWM